MRGLIGSLFESLAKNFNVVLVPQWRAARLPEERHLARLFDAFEIDCVFDVGANIGQYGQMLRKNVGYRGRIISFEPNPAVLTKLEQAASQGRNWNVERFALGPVDGTAKFLAHAQSDLSSFRLFGSSRHAPPEMATQEIEVPVRRLATYFQEAQKQFGFRRPFLKLDTQGFDVEVAKGAGDALQRFVGLQTEVAFQTIYDGAPDFINAMNFFQAAGFTLSQLVPIHEVHFPELVEMDAIMIRTNLINKNISEYLPRSL